MVMAWYLQFDKNSVYSKNTFRKKMKFINMEKVNYVWKGNV